VFRGRFGIQDDATHPGRPVRRGRRVARKKKLDRKRIDAYLSGRFPRFSRAIIQKLIQQKLVELNGEPVKKASTPVTLGDVIRLRLPALPSHVIEGEDIPLEILYEDEFLAVVNKPPGMVTHPARGHRGGTLANAVQFHLDKVSTVAGSLRPGIVHRLDRDTSGVIVVAKDDLAHRMLATQFERRTVKKRYRAIVAGRPDRDSDFIEQPLGKHPHSRTRMAIRPTVGKAASSFYEVVERFDGFALMQVSPATGRTHQIRVHLASIGCPVLADKEYGGRNALRVSDLAPEAEDADRVLIGRQALHACSLEFLHPRIREPVCFEAPMPQDFLDTLAALGQYRPYRRK